MKKLKVYTDGGCSMKNKIAGWAFLIIDPTTKQVAVQQSGTFENITNNQCEIYAVLEALHYIRCYEDIYNIEVEVVSDSEYVVKGSTTWIKQWKGKGWKTSTGPVKNKVLWEVLDNFLQEMRVTFTWVRGHSSDTFNNKVDKLAVDAYKRVIKEREQNEA